MLQGQVLQNRVLSDCLPRDVLQRRAGMRRPDRLLPRTLCDRLCRAALRCHRVRAAAVRHSANQRLRPRRCAGSNRPCRRSGSRL